MKKRRELDALVNNGKTGRRKANSSSSSSTKNGKHELLRSETDSSEIEFQLPAQKTAVIRKTRKRCHLCGTCISVCAFFMITLCLLACGGLIWLQVGLRKELDDLRAKIISVETGNKETPEALQSVHSKIQEINTKLNGKDGLKDMKEKETGLAEQVKKLNIDVSQLSKSVSEASKITALPDQVRQLKQNVASMGSSVSTLQDQVKTLQTFKESHEKDHNSMKESIDTLKEKMGVNSHNSNDTSTPSPAGDINMIITQKLTAMETEFKTTSSAVQAALQVIHMSVNNLQNRTAALENRVSSSEFASGGIPSKANVNINEIAKQVAETLQSHLNLTYASHTEVKNLTDNVNTQLKKLAGNIKNLRKRVDKTTNTIKDEVGNIEADLPPNLRNLTSQLTLLHNQLKKLNESKADRVMIPGENAIGPDGGVTKQQVDAIVRNALTSYQDMDKEDEKKYHEGIRKLNKTMFSLSNRIEKQMEQIAALAQNQNKLTKKVTLLEAKQESFNPEEDSEAPERPLHLTGIDNAEDLRNYFYVWDGDDDGYVTYNDIKNHMGIHTPPEKRMKHYDYDKDGKYSEYELSAAMGYEVYTPPPPFNPNATTPAPEKIHVPFIKTKEDLITNFNRWDRDGDFQVRLEDLPQFLGADMPRKHLFRPYDANADGLYNIQEMIDAFGFPPDTTPGPTTPGPSTTTTTEMPTLAPLVKIEVKGIDSATSLEDMFSYYDRDRDGYASYGELQETLGDKIPSPNYFQPYDVDGDGRFSLDELKMAFGFKPVPEDIAQGRTQVPMSQLATKTMTKRSTREKFSLLRKALQQTLRNHSKK